MSCSFISRANTAQCLTQCLTQMKSSLNGNYYRTAWGLALPSSILLQYLAKGWTQAETNCREGRGATNSGSGTCHCEKSLLQGCRGGEAGEGHHCAVPTGPKGNKLQHRRVKGELRKRKQLQRKRRYEAVSDDIWHVNNLLGIHLYVLSLCASSFQLGPASSTSFSASSPATGHLNSCVGAKEWCSWVVKESPGGHPLRRWRGGSMPPSQW